MGVGMQPYTANDLVRRLGNVLGLTPLGVVGSALDLIDAKRRDDFPGAVAAAAGMIPGAKGVAKEVGAALVPIKDLHLLHPPETMGSRPDLAGLSDEELLESVISPKKRDRITVDTDSNKVVDGNSRIFELQNRAANPTSSITADTRENNSKVAFHLADLLHNVPLHMGEVRREGKDCSEVLESLRMRAEQKGMTKWLDNALAQAK